KQIIVGTVIYAVALVFIVYPTRPTWRRFAGAIVGATAIVGLGLWGVVPFGEAMEWWRVPLDSSLSYMAFLFVRGTVSSLPLFLVPWRIARRFGWRGLAVTFTALSVIGPLREFAVEAMYPDWVTLAPNVATAVAISAGYVSAFAAGHGVMRLIAGP